MMLTNKPQRNIRIKCDVIEAIDKNGKDAASLFRGELNSAKDCDLILARSGLDHEVMVSYNVKMMINTLSAFVNPEKNTAEIIVNVQDKNDNAPVFEYKERYNDMIPSKYLVNIATGTDVGQEIYRVEATDEDSGDLGRVKYEISPDTEAQTRHFFKVDPESGAISLRKPVDEIEEDLLPFRKHFIIPHCKILPDKNLNDK